jgi:RNA polymerase sigma factor (sigma-70 family)
MNGIMGRDALGSGSGLATAADDVIRAPMSEARFAALFELHHGDVYRYILALTRSKDDADDVTAETFERAFRAWTAGPVVGENFLPWLLLTGRRIAIDRWRRLRRLSRLVPSLKASDATDAEPARTEFWLWFDALCAAIPERQREVLVLRYQGDLSDAHIGTIMGLSESGVRSLVARALASLREHPELHS